MSKTRNLTQQFLDAGWKTERFAKLASMVLLGERLNAALEAGDNEFATLYARMAELEKSRDDLLEACKIGLAYIDSLGFCKSAEAVLDTIAILHTAITKAEGE